MSPRIAYWCSSFDADIEAVASEVACLRRTFPGSVAWGIAARDKFQFSRNGIGFHPRLDCLFRAATWALQGRYDIQHLFGSLGDWFHLRALRRHPAVLTVAVQSDSVGDPKLLGKIDRFVVEWPEARRTLVEAGLEAGKIELIYPAVDLDRFQPSPIPEGPFTVLFASSPDKAEWLSARGVDLILDAAQLCPAVKFVLIWRPWGNSLPTLRRLVEERSLTNVEVVIGRFGDMAAYYRNAHITVAPFVDMSRCKPTPNSILESLSCARPVIVSGGVGIADLVRDSRAGLVCEATGPGLAECIERIASSWSPFSERAVALARASFCVSSFLGRYQRLYQELV